MSSLVSPPSNEQVTGRYSVAIGPKLMNPKYPDDGLLNKDDFKAFDKNIDSGEWSLSDRNKLSIL